MKALESTSSNIHSLKVLRIPFKPYVSNVNLHPYKAGVGLAFPIAKYDVEAVDISRLSDTRRWPREPKPDFGRAVQA